MTKRIVSRDLLLSSASQLHFVGKRRLHLPHLRDLALSHAPTLKFQTFGAGGGQNTDVAATKIIQQW